MKYLYVGKRNIIGYLRYRYYRLRGWIVHDRYYFKGKKR